MNTQNILIVSLLVGLSYQYKKINELLHLKEKKSKSNEIETQIYKENIKKDIMKEIYHRKLLEKRDRQVIEDPLVAGEKRLPVHQYPKSDFKKLINIPTQGQPENYQYLGNLVRDTDNKILPLFGRQYYPGSNEYEYYTMINQDSKFGLKIPINDGKKLRKFQDEQVVELDYFKSNEGEFKFKEFSYNAPRYNPYDY